MPAPPLILESEADVAAAVQGARVVAVLGAKDGSDPDAPAYRIPVVLRERGMRVIFVNPTFREIDGTPSYPTLADVPEAFDAVDVFRAPRWIPGHVAQILALPAARRPSLVWLQSGIRHDDAARRLAEAGLRVVQDRCLGVYAARYRNRV
jgi:predicted CoA-binding protein